MYARIQVGILEVVLLLLMTSLPLHGQGVSGKVTDARDGQPLTSVIVRSVGQDGETLDYVMTDKEGRFSIATGDKVKDVRITLIGYKEATLFPPFGGERDIALEPEEMKIKESVIQARKVRTAGDTTIYNVKALKTRDDLVLGDVLKRIPGIEVTSSGHLKVDGRDLGKFYVNGKDVLEGNYNLAIRKLSVDAVKKVEILRNHQYIKMLQGMKESDLAAVNIVLDADAKGRVNAIGAFGGGYQASKPYFPNTESMTAFYLGNEFSSVLDAGFDASGQPARDITYYRLPLSDNRYSIQSKLNIASSQAPLGDTRSLFNKSFDTRSVNTLSPSEDDKLGATFSYSWDERNSSSTKTSTYHFSDRPDKVIAYRETREERGGKLTGRLSYSNNASRHYISDVLFADIGKNTGKADVSGDDIRNQRGDRRTWDVNNTLNTLFRTKAGTAIGIKSYTQLSGFNESLGILTGPQRQDVRSSAIFEDLSFDSIKHTRGNITFSFQPILKWTYLEKFSSLEGLSDQDIPGQKNDNSRATYLTIGLTWNLYYRKGAFTAFTNGDIHYDNARYGLYTEGKILFDESAGMKYETGRIAASTEGGVSTKQPDIQDLGAVLILYDYDCLRRGQESLSFLPMRYIQGELIYREPVNGWYMRLNSKYNKKRSLLEGRDVLENYILSYNTSETVGYGLWTSSAEITKGMYSINGKVSARISFNRLSSTFRQNEVSISYVSKILSPSAELTLSPFSFWKMTGTGLCSFVRMRSGTDHKADTRNMTFSLTNTFYLTERFSAGVVTDIFHNSTVEKTMIFPDAFISWKSPSKIILKLQASNLLNVEEYSFVSISPLMETTYSHRIRPLCVMLFVNWTI